MIFILNEVLNGTVTTGIYSTGGLNKEYMMGAKNPNEKNIKI